MSARWCDIEDQLATSDPDASQSTIDAAVAAGIVFGVIAGLLGALLWLWMAWKNGQGRSWARMFALILTVLNLLLAIVILVLLWRKESSEFYAASSR